MDSDTATMTPSLLRQLRRCGTLKQWPGGIDYKESLQLLIQHQSEFPLQIRQAIPAEADELPEAHIVMSQIAEIVKAFFFLGQPEYNKASTRDKTSTRNEAAKSIGGGLNCQVDTEEEVELTIRFFPSVIYTAVWIDNKVCYLVAWATTRLKSLPFVPLIAELTDKAFCLDAGLIPYVGNEVCFYEELITNECLLRQEPRIYEDEEDFHCRVDETCASVLVRLKEKDLICDSMIWDCMEDLLNLNRPASQTKKRLRTLIDLDPAMLQPGMRYHRKSVLGRFLKRCHCLPSIEDKLERFWDIAELGMSHYPHQLGLLFSWRPTITHACQMFGKKKVTTMANECIHKWTQERSDNAICELVFAAARKGDITLDVLYFLLRQDPTVWMPATRNGIGNSTKKTTRHSVKRSNPFVPT